MGKLLPFRGKVSVSKYLKLICQRASDSPDEAMSQLSDFILDNKMRIHRLSYLAGIVHGAIMRTIRTDALSHKIPEILDDYGKPPGPIDPSA